MRITLIAIGTRMPVWVKTGFADYAARLPRECPLELLEIPTARRSKNAARLLREEGERILAAVPRGARLIILDVDGRSWDTAQLAEELERWLQDGRNVALAIGGPDGLDAACRAYAETAWSLSRLTLPHALVRIIVAEQLYRAWSMLQHHPYHRG